MGRALAYPARGIVPAISWGAVIAGWLFAYAFATLLYLFGAAIGFTTMAAINDLKAGIAIGTGIWIIVAWIAATFAGSMLAGRLSNSTNPRVGAAHGLVVWALSAVMTMFVAGASAATAAGVGVGAATAAAQTVEERGETQTAQDDESTLAAQLPTEQEAEQAAEDAGDVASGTLWVLFLASLLGLAAGAYGGMIGTRYAEPDFGVRTRVGEGVPEELHEYSEHR